jgi:peptide/nickel transport system permease protein
MKKPLKTTPEPPSATDTEQAPQWLLDLDKVGFVRRLFIARKWYGGDWWFVVISAVLLVFIIIVGIFPQWFAPYDPRAEVGPSLLAPGDPPPSFLLITPVESGDIELRDIADSSNNIGFIIGSPASQAFREAVDALNETAPEGVRYQPRQNRFESLEEGLDSLAAGEIDGFIASPDELGSTIEDYPTLQVTSTLREEGDRGFIFGTNQIGQDVFSRIIWGTRIALIVGLSSALVSFVIGVPLGLISGFAGGPFDRGLTLVMDSLYSFPGLILAIAIAAVLGAGIGNIIVSIAVLYVPTYFRIVRGQTLTVKKELYVDAARSLGTSWWKILTKYIFPNVIPSVVIIFSVNVGDAILTEAGLSFLGFGLPPDTPDWGIDLARGQDYVRRAWWLITYPGLMVTLVTLSFSMLGESLSEILNPRLTER